MGESLQADVTVPPDITTQPGALEPLSGAHYDWAKQFCGLDPGSVDQSSDPAVDEAAVTPDAAGMTGSTPDGTSYSAPDTVPDGSQSPAVAPSDGGMTGVTSDGAGYSAPVCVPDDPQQDGAPGPAAPITDGASDGAPAQQQEREDADFERLMAEREGRRNTVYLDSLGKPTVGIGHLVTPGDKLTEGDKITDEQVTAFFRKDSSDAMGAARSQAAEAGIKDSAFMPYLASVNFQLGTKWTGKFPKTWKMIVDGSYEDAAKALDGTLWSKQTPVRVKDFQDALRKLPAKQ